MSTLTFTVTETNAAVIANIINGAFATDSTITVNGDQLFGRWSAPADAWGNGSVSVKVPAKKASSFNTRYFKVGATVVITDTH